MAGNEQQEVPCDVSGVDFPGLSAAILKCTLKRLEEHRHTDLCLRS